MEISGSADGVPVPEVLLEAYFESESGTNNVVHIRVSGHRYEFDALLRKFTELCSSNRWSTKGTVIG